MNVRITPGDAPQRTDLYGGVVAPVTSDGVMVRLVMRFALVELLLATVAEIALDDEPGECGV